MIRDAVLLVEDNPDDEALILRALARAKVENEIVVVRDGVEALDYLFATGSYRDRDPDRTPVAVLLDLRLPKMHGLEVLKKIRAAERTKHTPVIILTSSDEEKDILEGYRSGCNSYVQKPIEFGDFAQAVRQVGLYWLLVNKTAV